MMEGEAPEPNQGTPQGSENQAGLGLTPEAPRVESGMEKWDKLDEQIEGLKTQEDSRLLNLLRDVHGWRESQILDESDGHYYFATQENGTNVQLEVAPNRFQYGGKRIIVVESSLGPEEDPNTVSNKTIIEGRLYEPQNRGTFKGGVVYDYDVHNLDSVDKMVTERALVGYKSPDERTYPWHHPQGFKNAYGRTSERIGYQEVLRNRPSEKEKRVDPISEGERVLNLLKSARPLGRFNEKTGRLEPIQPNQVSPSPVGSIINS